MDQVQEYQQDQRSDEGDEDRARKPAERRAPAGITEDESSEERADDADDEITDNSITRTAHDERCQHTSDESNDEPSEDVHVVTRSIARASGEPPPGANRHGSA